MVVTLNSINPFAKINVSQSSIGMILVIIAIIVIILILVGVLIWIYFNKKSYWIKIHTFKLIGNTPTRVGLYKAKEVAMSKAGDKLWFVKGIKKWLPPAEMQSAPNEYWFWIRADGEWINFTIDNIDKLSKVAGAKFVHRDMALQRLATDQLLQQRLLKKSFWEQWGQMIGYIVFFLTITICLMIMFHQYTTILKGQAAITDQQFQITKELTGKGGADTGIIPALIPITLMPYLIKKRRLNNGCNK